MMGRAWGQRAVAAVAAAVLVVGAAGTARAGTIVNDTWLDGTDTDPAAPQYSEMGIDSDGDGNIESAWFQGGVGSLDPVGAGGPLRGNMTAGGTQSASWTTYATPEATPITLGQGENMKVTWKFSLSNVNTSNTSQNFRVALVDSPSATRVAGANGSPGSGAYTGYGMFMNMGQTLANGNAFQLRERVVASGDLLSTSGNWGANGTANAGLGNGATNGAPGYTAGTVYTMVWDLTHTLADELAINVTMTGGTLDNDGVASVSVVDPSPNGFTFDTFGIRPSGATTTAELFDTSQFQVDFNPVPEPASMALLSLGGLAMLRRRRSA